LQAQSQEQRGKCQLGRKNFKQKNRVGSLMRDLGDNGKEEKETGGSEDNIRGD
jgi:hypothetical protein